MSVCIKGMEMPRHCGECGIEWCGLWKKLIIAGMSIAKSRPADCPLVEVPDHGRLIDADEFLNRAIGTKCFRGDFALMLQELVSESMTIIPADKEAWSE